MKSYNPVCVDEWTDEQIHGLFVDVDRVQRLQELREEFDRCMDAVCDKNDYSRSWHCPHCSVVITYADGDVEHTTPCHAGFRRAKTPQWIAARSYDEGKHNCPINRACWEAANVLLIAECEGLDAAVMWKLTHGGAV